MTELPKECRNVLCRHGGVVMLRGVEKAKRATADLHPASGLCPKCQKKLITDPKPSACVGCPLYEIGEGFAMGEGPVNAKMWWLGEALGEEEASQGRPFVGGSGRMLNAMGYQAGVYRNDVYVTNTVKCRPPGNREPDDEEIRWCARYLAREIKERRPNVIVALGAVALYACTGHNKIGTYRGIPTEGPSGIKVVPSFHPAFVARQQMYWPVVVFDLHKAKSESEFPEIRRLETVYDITCSAPSTRHSLLAGARRAGFITLDLETTDLDPSTSAVRCYGAGYEPGRASVYEWDHESQRLILELLNDPTIVKVGQYSEGFDWPYLEYKARTGGLAGDPKPGWEVTGPTADTMIMMHLTNSDLPKNLATISTFYTDMPYWKDEEMYKTTHENLKKGCAKDIDGTTRSFLGLRDEIRAYGMDNLFWKNVMPLQPVLRRMKERGLKKDQLKAFKWAVGMRQAAEKREALLRSATGMPNLNVESSKDMFDFLYNKLGLPIQYKRDRVRGLRPTADKEAIKKLVELFPEHKFLALVNDIRSAYHTISTNLEVPTDERDFVHPRFGCWTAANGRLNSWDPNAQNQPVPLREIFIPDDEDHIFIAADWSQIEWRLAMVLSSDPLGLEMLTNGLDIHKQVGAEGFGIRYEDVTEDGPGNLRDATKFIVYGLGYGRGNKDIAKQLRRDQMWVASFVAKFFSKLRAYYDWRESLDVIVKETNFLANPFGRRRWWYTRQVTEQYNFPPSSTAADMMYVALRILEQQLPSGATLRLTVHDEAVVCAHRDVVKEAATCMKEVMEMVQPEVVAFARDPKTVKKFYPNGWYAPAEVTFGPKHWAQCKAKKLQPGFRKEFLS